MITTTTKIQLLIFAIVTVLGAAFVGGRYAKIDRLVIDRTYPVAVDLEKSGGIYTGAEVTYRGLPIGKVAELQFRPSGVRATLDIEKKAPRIPSDVLAVVANKSAIGEQYVDLQPRTASGPFLSAGSVIPAANTKVPLDTTQLLLDVGELTSSVDVTSLQTLVNELGIAFAGNGEALGVIVDTLTSFLQAADANFPATRQLIRSSGSVLDTLVDKRSQFASLTEDLTLLTGSLVDEKDSIDRLISKGPKAERVISAVLKENQSDLVSLFNSLEEVTGTVNHRWKSIETLSVLLPLIVDGSFSTMMSSKTRPGKDNVAIGLIFPPLDGKYTKQMCRYQYGGSDAAGYRAVRPPNDLTTAPMQHFDCLNDAKVPLNPRKVLYNYNRSVTAPAAGEDSWKWLLLGTASN